MRKTITFVVLWLLAGTVAATVAWLGVSSVSDELAGSSSHPDPLSAEEIRAEVAAAPSTTTSTPTTAVPTSITTTTREATPTTGTPGATSTTTAPPNAGATTRSYDLIGGTATLRFSPSGVTVVVATPAPGFSVELGSSHSNGAKVEFEGESHQSEVEGWWDGGPQDEVREDAED